MHEISYFYMEIIELKKKFPFFITFGPATWAVHISMHFPKTQMLPFLKISQFYLPEKPNYKKNVKSIQYFVVRNLVVQASYTTFRVGSSSSTHILNTLAELR